MGEIEYRAEVFTIIGAAMEVHSYLGAGFLESVYQEAMEHELRYRQVPFMAQQLLTIRYKSFVLAKGYIADIVAFDRVIVELKAAECLTSRDMAQLLNYLKAANRHVGLLINFGSVGRLEWKRIVYGTDG